ncbi:STM4015 family protein [Clostridium senegalense]|uniref:STM4015 family protein n=1 Tax=Clostridium senegalense TaxID=1465809 RepID=UPI001C101E8F|nr:STM4015 family protein [Clostridium senegalense]MBU5225951.1 STM4015 family protein [Clostridium senegalense]
MESKKYFYDYEDYEDGDKDAKTLASEILEDSDLGVLKEVIVGCWGESYDNDVQAILDMIVENKEKFAHIESLFIGDMDYEECEVSWIEQGDYSRIWDALPNLRKLTIKGSQGLSLGNINHKNLKSLEIICGGIPKLVLNQIGNSNLPGLEKLNIYIGIDNYGFDGELEDIKKVVENESLKSLKYLGIGNSEIQDDIVKVVIESNIIKQLETLNFSNGTLSDIGGNILLENKDKINHLKFLDLHYHFLSDELMYKLNKLPIKIDLDEQEEVDEEYGNWPMLTE